MKNLLLFLLISVSGFTFGQSMNEIKNTVQSINKTKDFKIKTVPYSYYLNKSVVTDNGIELKGFYKNGKLRKMEYFVGLSVWNVVTQFFFSEKNQLIFVYEKRYLTRGENAEVINPKLVSEKRFYFMNSKLYKKTGNEEGEENLDYVQESLDLINDLQQYK
ncbi:hypothetical protein [Chryseobacterium sp. RR2-3-20]|uniref:hypothetical protein n=1 Tax=Chryseobacterium sp. RR2-3-20 TaxID=2787626 RepID=UPI001ADEC717|nr:hypothetical protein [Chryseobacterium sp. RR2-3-20]